MKPTVIIFGDNLGIPTTLDALPPDTTPVIVFDPKRKDILQYGDSIESYPFPDKDKRTNFITSIMAFQPVIGIINSFSRILWPELLDLFPMGVVNIHLSKLPEYRGANTLQWTIINGEKSTAATLHRVDQGIDTGPIIDEQIIAIDNDDTATTLQKKLVAAAAVLLKSWLPRIMVDPVAGTPQDSQLARTWKRRTPEEGRINWSWSDERIRNLTRALVAPWPGAWYKNSTGAKVIVNHALTLAEIRAIRQEINT